MHDKLLMVGKEAVRDAMRISRLIQMEMSAGVSISKSDRSPVTVADFTSQAIICRKLKEFFPDIPIVAEESSDPLKNEAHKGILEKIYHYIRKDRKVSRILRVDNLFESIDFGKGEPDNYFWTLDPIDGTKGFLRGEQYAIALALIKNGEVQMGILGCPNLELKSLSSDRGYVFYAQLHRGITIEAFSSVRSFRSKVSEETAANKMRFVQSYESSHGNLPVQLKIAEILRIEGEPVQMDSQVKYGVVSSGDAEIYIRIPHPESPNYKEKIWDHAAGSLLVTEAGGVVTDIYGKKLDFGVGKTLKNNTGVVVAVPKIHKRLLEIIRGLM